MGSVGRGSAPGQTPEIDPDLTVQDIIKLGRNFQLFIIKKRLEKSIFCTEAEA